MSVKLGHFFEGHSQGENEKSFLPPKYGGTVGFGLSDKMYGFGI